MAFSFYRWMERRSQPNPYPHTQARAGMEQECGEARARMCVENAICAKRRRRGTGVDSQKHKDASACPASPFGSPTFCHAQKTHTIGMGQSLSLETFTHTGDTDGLYRLDVQS